MPVSFDPLVTFVGGRHIAEETGRCPGQVVNPGVAEYLVGLPIGWTSPHPLPHRERIASLLRAGIPKKRLNTLDLFSGCLGLALGLRKTCRSVAYCDVDPDARRTIKARIEDKLVENGPIFSDVRNVNAQSLAVPIQCVCAGFPCTDISTEGTLVFLQHSLCLIVAFVAFALVASNLRT
jgi:C-5 cytosine-specific DNA methylase